MQNFPKMEKYENIKSQLFVCQKPMLMSGVTSELSLLVMFLFIFAICIHAWMHECMNSSGNKLYVINQLTKIAINNFRSIDKTFVILLLLTFFCHGRTIRMLTEVTSPPRKRGRAFYSQVMPPRHTSRAVTPEAFSPLLRCAPPPRTRPNSPTAKMLANDMLRHLPAEPTVYSGDIDSTSRVMR